MAIDLKRNPHLKNDIGKLKGLVVMRHSGRGLRKKETIVGIVEDTMALKIILDFQGHTKANQIARRVDDTTEKAMHASSAQVNLEREPQRPRRRTWKKKSER